MSNNQLAEALREAAQSLETIAKNAGKKLDSDGLENYLHHHDQVRGYAASRAGVARAALAATPAPAPELLEALISFTKSEYIKHQHPKRYAKAIAAIDAAMSAPEAAKAPLTDEQIVTAANDAFDTTIDLDDETLVNKYGHGIYISRYLDFARAIERAHGIGQGKEASND